eukprot:UN08735
MRKFLWFGVDSALCSSSELSLLDFWKYDYVGAPWSHINAEYAKWGGNGGVTIYNSTIIKRVLKRVSLYYR